MSLSCTFKPVQGVGVDRANAMENERFDSLAESFPLLEYYKLEKLHCESPVFSRFTNEPTLFMNPLHT